MVKRLGIGILKGLLVGGAIAAGLHFGLGWTTGGTLLGYLLAMATGATAGLLAGKPPWKQEAWIEGILKAVGGIVVGALLFGLGSNFADFALPFALPNTAADLSWTALPLIYMPVVAMIYGGLIELDNTPDEGEQPKSGGKAPRTRVAEPVSADIEDAVIISEKKSI